MKEKIITNEKRTPNIRPSKIFIFGNSSQTIEYDLLFSPRLNFNSKELMREAYSPRDADVLVIFGPITHKILPNLKIIYEQMCSPKWVIEVASIPVINSYSLVKLLSDHIPVDLYLNKINPTPLELWNAIQELK